MANIYVAQITLGFTPSNGDLIRGTINGVEVRGEWSGTEKEGNVVLKSKDNTPICSVGFIDGRTIIDVRSDSAPTTDYELHLYHYVPACIVQIPQEYVEGLEATAADATEAKATAETAQSTANAAKTAAETAQSTANSAKTTAKTAQSTANAAKTMAENAATKENPEFTGSFSQNRKPGTTIGTYSHAEGSSTTASGNVTHAEGAFTIASGMCSHAEGDHTIAQGMNQHVEGRYNIPSGENSAYSASDYVHIVGNGNFENARSNAHTLTWSGVPWYQGRPQFGGNEMNDGAKTVMGNGDKEIILSSSTPNSTKKFKITVDDAGVISATEVTT